MPETSYYHRLALLLYFLGSSAISLVSSHALPANRPPSPPNRPPSPPNLPPLALPNQNNALTITQNIQALVNFLAADPSIQYSQSQMYKCELVVLAFEHGDEPHDLEHSSDINEFRDIQCVFRFGGFPDDEGHAQFLMQNKLYPDERWDLWALPAWYNAPGHPYPSELWRPFNWTEEFASGVGIERADQLLKAAGHEPGEGYIGQYDMVTLTQPLERELA
ncbi:MAG: hypothetical protein Q9216_005468, partial [Gyalolechia sp. 2 TL-2023]